MKPVDIRPGAAPLGSIVTFHTYEGTHVDALVIGHVVCLESIDFVEKGVWEYCTARLNLLVGRVEWTDVGRAADPNNPVARTWSPKEEKQ